MLGSPTPVLGLQGKTDPAWTAVALSDTGALLEDHAHLERKAAGQVITLIGRLPAGGEGLLAVAREELDHFERVCGLLRARGRALGADPGNPYVQALAKATGNALLDRVLRMGIIEARSYEHFALLADAATGDLGQLYEDLKDSEAGHHAFFIKLAYEHWPRDEVRARWHTLAEAEARIVAGLEWGPRVH